MKTQILIFLISILSVSSVAQIGINTTIPNAMLDISSGTNGVLLPRIALTANNVAAPVVNPQGGALPTSTLIYNTATVAGVNGVVPGYYYWSGTLWLTVGGTISNDWKILGNTATIEPANPLIYGTSTMGVAENFVGTIDNNDLILGTSQIERLRIKKGSGNIGIGTANPTNKLHVSTSNAGLTSLFTENTFVGNTTGIGIIGSAVNNPGFGIGGQFFGGSIGLQSTANATIFTGTATGISGISTGSGGATATRVGGLFASSGVNVTNYGGRFTATGATTNYGADFLSSGIATRNYGGNFSASGGTTGNWAGVFNSTGGAIATGADFFADNGTSTTTAGYFEAKGTTTNYGGRFATYGPGYSTGATTNYAGNFLAFGAINNYAGYFSATGGTNNYAIVVPSNSGNVGIGTITPTTKVDIVSPGNTLGLRLLSGNSSQLSYLSVGKVTEYAQIGACNAGTFFTDALDGDMAIKNYNSGKILLGASFIANAAMSIIPGGNVGIGISSPTYRLHVTDSSTNNATAYVENTTNFSGIGIEGRASGVNNGIGGRFTGSGIGVAGIGISVLGGTSPKGGVFSASTTATTNYGITADASGGVSANYAGYFTANGNTTNIGGYFSATGAPTNNYAIIVPANEGRVGIGTSAPVDQLEVAGGYVRSTGYRCRTGTAGTYPGNVYNINWNGSSSQLWIDATNVGTFQFTSDRRLKDNVTPINDSALSRVMLLKPVSFNYKNIPDTIFSGSDQIVEGFIADELQQIIPSAVNGEKDGLTKEGKIQPQTLNMSPIISVLTKAIQEQQILIVTLTQKYNLLELQLKTLENK